MKKYFINKEEIEILEVIEESKNSSISFQEGRKKTFFKKELKEGFVFEFAGRKTLLDSEKLKNNHIIRGTEVFNKPAIKFHLKSGTEIERNFPSMEDLNFEIERIFSFNKNLIAI